jgi:hypothetical protein
MKSSSNVKNDTKIQNSVVFGIDLVNGVTESERLVSSCLNASTNSTCRCQIANANLQEVLAVIFIAKRPMFKDILVAGFCYFVCMIVKLDGRKVVIERRNLKSHGITRAQSCEELNTEESGVEVPERYSWVYRNFSIITNLRQSVGPSETSRYLIHIDSECFWELGRTAEESS